MPLNEVNFTTTSTVLLLINSISHDVHPNCTMLNADSVWNAEQLTSLALYQTTHPLSTLLTKLGTDPDLQDNVMTKATACTVFRVNGASSLCQYAT